MTENIEAPQEERREPSDRRANERRQQEVPVAEERRQGQRRKVQRRRQIDPTTCERDYTKDEIEFMQALDDYKRASGRMFPTCSEILEVVRKLGYVKLDDFEIVEEIDEELDEQFAEDGSSAEAEDTAAVETVED